MGIIHLSAACGLAALCLAQGALAEDTLSARPSAVVFPYGAGQPVPDPLQIAIQTSNGVTPVLTARIAPQEKTPAGLFQIVAAGGMVNVGLAPGPLGDLLSHTGVYRATLSVIASGFQPLQIPVTLDLAGDLSLESEPPDLQFQNATGTASKSVKLAAHDGASLSFTLSAATSAGGDWLTVTSDSTYTPATLHIKAAAQGLPANKYTGRITVTPQIGAAVDIPVALITGPTSITVKPETLGFEVGGGTAPAPKVLDLSSSVPSQTYTAQGNSDGDWLLVNGVATPVGGVLPSHLNVTVNPQGMAPGAYQGTVAITAADGSTQNVAVTVVVNPAPSSTP